MFFVIFVRGIFAISLLATIGLALYPDFRLPSHWPAGEHSDRVYHVLAFASLATLAAFIRRLDVVSITGLTMLAVGLELAQIVTPGRQADAVDLLASLLGVALGLSAGYLINAVRQRHARFG